MKRFLSLLLILLLAASNAACSKQKEPAETPAPANTQMQAAPTKAQTPDLSPTPKLKPFAPMDIFGDEFNPFGMDSPFTVFAAEFNKGSAKLGGDPFTLYMTGSGNMFACVAYIADVSGLGLDEGGKFALLEEYRANGYFCEFIGSDGQIVTIRQANPNDDRYEYVKADGQHDFHGGGCVIDITYYVNDADIEKYTKLVRDNYNLNALSPIAEYFNAETDFRECGITVNLHKNEAKSYAVYYLPNVDAVQKGIENNVQGGWWEWNGMKQTVIQYGPIESMLTCDNNGGAITIEQMYAEFSTAMGEFAEAPVSLTKLGFGFDDAGTCGVYEQHEPHYMSVAIHRPEWGEHPDGWNIEFMDEVNGYGLRITYHADEGKYHISVDKDGESSAYDTYPAKDEYGWEYPDLDKVHKMFNNAFGTKEKELYFKPLAYFSELVKERFGMSIDELYSLPVY